MFPQQPSWRDPNQKAEMLDQRQIALAIQALRRRLDAAKETGQSPALIRALGETLAEFEAGRLPHRYPSRLHREALASGSKESRASGE